MLTYTAGHINYGGRVTDDWDRRCLLCLLADYYTNTVLSDKYYFDENGAFKQVTYTVGESVTLALKLPPCLLLLIKCDII